MEQLLGCICQTRPETGRGALAGALLLSSILSMQVAASEVSVGAQPGELQQALNNAQCGDTIYLDAGTYYESIDTARDCSAEQPLTIIGPRDAVIAGDSARRIIDIRHDHHHLIGFTIDGLTGSADSQASYRDKLVYVKGSPQKYLEGFKLIGMALKNAGSECVRLRYVHQAEIAGSDISDCGVFDFRFAGGGKNGEGVYVGTPASLWTEQGEDHSDASWIHDNTIRTNGNECIEIKEGASASLIEHNHCSGQRVDNAAGIDMRGDDNTVRYNRVHDNDGSGIRLGGPKVQGTVYGINNRVYGNTVYANDYGGVKIVQTPQIICANQVTDNPGGSTRGTYRADYDPGGSCPDDIESADPALSSTPAPAPTSPPAPDENPGEDTALAVDTVSASADDGNSPANTLDGDLQTRWSAQGDGQWIQYDLGTLQSIGSVAIAFYKGSERTMTFSLAVSENGATWTTVVDRAQSSGSSDQPETFAFTPVSARQLRIIGYGNSSGNGWNSLTEVVIAANAGSTAPPQPAPQPDPEPAPAPQPDPEPAPVPDPQPTPQPDPQPDPQPSPEQPAKNSIWLDRAELAALPMSGSAWDNLRKAASSSCGTPDLSDQEDASNVCVMAKALVFARTGDDVYLQPVLGAINSVVNAGTYNGRALALARELVGYVIAADLIDLQSHDAALDQRFRKTLKTLLTTPTSGGPGNLIECHEKRPNNWGTHCGATRAAVAAYLGDSAGLERVAEVFKGWLGDRNAYAGFSYGDLSWQCDPNRPVGINPPGCKRDGHVIAGALPDDQRRAGGFTWPPTRENYVYEALQGALVQAVILTRAGYDAFQWQDQALRRAFVWLNDEAKFPAEGDDTWQPFLINYYYGTNFSEIMPARPGKNVGWTDWTHR